MTAPISFPTITPPQLAPQPQGPLSDLPQLIFAISQHRDAVAQAQENLALERQRTEASVAASGAATANSKQDLKDKQQAFDQKEKIMQAHDIVANELPGILTKPGDFTQNAEAARVKLIQANKQLAPFINDAFNSQMADVSNTRTAIANRRTAEANAPVVEQTAASRVALSKSEAAKAAIETRRAATEAETAKIQLHLAQLDQTYGPGRSTMATSVLAGGGTLGQAYRISGVPIPPGVDPTWTTNKGTTSALAARQKDYASLMDDAMPEIEKVYDKVNGKAVTAMAKFPLAANGLGDANTQKYMTNFRDWLAGLLHEESGARLNDTQLSWGIARYGHIAGNTPSANADNLRAMRAVTAARKKNANFTVPGAPYSDEALQTFSGAGGANNGLPSDVHKVVMDRFMLPGGAKPPR